MRPIFSGSTLNTGGLLTESSNRIITENSNALNQERGLTKIMGWATDGVSHYVTTNTPSSPLKSEGLAYDSDGALHVSLAAPSSPLIHEGLAISSTGALHVFDLSATLLTEASATITTESSDQIIAESTPAFTFSGIPVTASGQLCYT